MAASKAPQSFLPEFGFALLPVALKLIASTLMVLSSWVALSDDDFSRVYIAQQFAENPSLDPSRTSWLPFPFWLQGGAMRVFSPTFEAARWVAIVLSAVALLPLYLAARWWGASRTQAVLGVSLAGLFPYSLLLGAITPPDGFTGALLAASILLLASHRPHRAAIGEGSEAKSQNAAHLEAQYQVAAQYRQVAYLVGAALLLCATLSRYEAWPVALVFGVTVAYRAIWGLDSKVVWSAEGPGLGAFLPTLIAALGPTAWMAHGHVNHGDAFFFVTRVQTYQTALGDALGPSGLGWAGIPLGLVSFEPELVLVSAAALGLLLVKRSQGASSSETLWPILPIGSWVAIGALLFFLLASQVASASATHHAERTLLSLWMLLAVLAVRMLARLHQERSQLGSLLILVALAVGIGLRLFSGAHPVGTPRAAERAMARAAHGLVPPSQVIGIATDDYGYFAILTTLGPERAVRVLKPRSPSPGAETSGGPSGEAADGKNYCSLDTPWLILPKGELAPGLPKPCLCHDQPTAHLCTWSLAIENQGFALLRLAPAPKG